MPSCHLFIQNVKKVSTFFFFSFAYKEREMKSWIDRGLIGYNLLIIENEKYMCVAHIFIIRRKAKAHLIFSKRVSSYSKLFSNYRAVALF